MRLSGDSIMINMSRKAEFRTYHPKTILNKSRRANSLFWTRYSAYPYIGCQHGCHFCYCREQKFSPYADYHDFPYIIKVKENAPDLLRRALMKVPVDVIFTGDYQPLERKFQISRKMLEVCEEIGFPVLVLERSPLVLRDLDILAEINSKARAVVMFSILCAPNSASYERVRYMEGLAPPAEKRFDAMKKLASAGLLTGTCLMPVLPGIGDDEESLKDVVRWTSDNGGKFVLFGGLTLADQQRDYYLGVIDQHFPDVADTYRKCYPAGSYGPNPEWSHRRAILIHEWCEQFGIQDRMPRPVIPGDKRELNKWIVEKLAYREHLLELNRAPEQQVWRYRKAAWGIEDLEQDIRLVYRVMGVKGLQSIPDMDPTIAVEIEKLIHGYEKPTSRNDKAIFEVG
jgi:DNA repair photolyase